VRTTIEAARNRPISSDPKVALALPEVMERGCPMLTESMLFGVSQIGGTRRVRWGIA